MGAARALVGDKRLHGRGEQSKVFLDASWQRAPSAPWKAQTATEIEVKVEVEVDADHARRRRWCWCERCEWRIERRIDGRIEGRPEGGAVRLDFRAPILRDHAAVVVEHGNALVAEERAEARIASRLHYCDLVVRPLVHGDGAHDVCGHTETPMHPCAADAEYDPVGDGRPLRARSVALEAAFAEEPPLAGPCGGGR